MHLPPQILVASPSQGAFGPLANWQFLHHWQIATFVVEG